MSYITRAVTSCGGARIIFADTTDIVRKAAEIHGTSKTMTAALGRVLTATAMMGSLLKDKDNSITVQFKGNGPAGTVVCVSDYMGNVRGYAEDPTVELAPNEKGKLDVGGAIGVGILNVIKDMGLKEPYNGTVELKTGEIGDDLTYYFATSEQVPSAVGLGVLMNKDNTVKQAGGFIIQLMPFIDEKVVDKLEEKLANVKSVTSMLDAGLSPEMILEELLGEFDLEITDHMATQFYCNCDKKRVEKALIGVGRKNLNDMVQDGETIEVGCHFCNTKYEFTVEELKELIKRSK